MKKIAFKLPAPARPFKVLSPHLAQPLINLFWQDIAKEKQIYLSLFRKNKTPKIVLGAILFKSGNRLF
jgi:hypothetical protein